MGKSFCFIYSLHCRTDFFRVMKTETDKLGFPPGIAHKLLENVSIVKIVLMYVLHLLFCFNICPFTNGGGVVHRM